MQGDQLDLLGSLDRSAAQLDSATALLQLLDDWLANGWLRALDRAFAGFLLEQAPETSPAVLLAAALVSHQLGHGHVCLDLAATLSEGFVSIATADSLPFWSFISAGIVNLFVPSGGGQWAVQAPVMIPAAQALGADLSRVAMAVAWGDAWTNMLQPFWALPVLAIAGLKAKDIMGFCLVQLLVTGIIISLGLTLL